MTMPTPAAGGRRIATISATVVRAWPNRYDIVVFLAVGALFVAVAHGAKSMRQPLEGLESNPVSLDPRNLPEYALLTTLRMFAALAFSLLFIVLAIIVRTFSQIPGVQMAANDDPFVSKFTTSNFRHRDGSRYRRWTKSSR